MRSIKFIISGGGTGGHIYPAISIANMIMKSIPNSEVRFVGAIGKMEMKIIPKHGFKIKGLWISGLQRSLSVKNRKRVEYYFGKKRYKDKRGV